MANGPMRDKYGVKPGLTLSADEFERLWNAVVDDFSRLVPQFVSVPSPGELNFPWKTSATPYDDGDDTPRLWRIDVQPGTVNDLAPPIIYRAKDDPRGWEPETTPAAGVQIVERSLAEYDRPWLLLTAPISGSTDPKEQFKKVDDTARPAFFRTADMWEFDLYRASVFLSNTVTDLSGPNLPLSFLSRLASAVRLSAGALPSIALGSEAGVLELARLYLLRDPGDPAGDNDTIMVQQKVYYCVQAELDSPNPAYLISVQGPAGDVSNVDPSLVSFDFWTA